MDREAPKVPKPSSPFDECRKITRAEGRNFYLGMLILPRPKRLAMFALYAFSRRVDDVADGSLPVDEKLRRLDNYRTALLEGGDSEDAPTLALRATMKKTGLPPSILLPLIEGALWDVMDGHIDTTDELLEYCRLVAGSIGQACAWIYGRSDSTALSAASDLGVALQLTNISRDIREDHHSGRTYLPEADLSRRGIDIDAALAGDGASRKALVEYLLHIDALATTYYHSGLRLIDMLDRRSAASCATMALTYHGLQARIAANPTAILSARVRVPAHKKLLVLSEALLHPYAQAIP